VKERALDEFESVFRRSIIPTIEVEKIEIARVVVLADLSPLAASCGRLARHLKERFGARVLVRLLERPADDEGRRRAAEIGGDEQRVVETDPVAHLREVIEQEKPSLILAPAPLHLGGDAGGAESLGAFVEALLVATSIPTLLVRRECDSAIFRRILVQIPGGRHDLIEQFSFAFALCPPGGTIRLLHVVDEADLARLAAALEVAPGIDSRAGQAELLSAVEARMGHLLRGAVRTAADAAFAVESAVVVGDPFAVVPAQARDFSLLIVGSQASHAEFLESRADALIQRLPSLCVLAL